MCAKKRKEKRERQKQERFLKSAGLEARDPSEIAKIQDLAICFPSPDNLSSAQSISCINSSYDYWTQFADEHQSIDIYLNLNSRAKWKATMIVKIKLAKNSGKKSYTGSRKFQKLSIKHRFETCFRNLIQI